MKVGAGLALLGGAHSSIAAAGRTLGNIGDGEWKAIPVGNTGSQTATVEPKTSEPNRRLRLVNAHNWEKLDLIYWAEGEYLQASVDQLNHLMRDHRAEVSFDMDVKLFDYLHNLYRLLDTDGRIHVLSGYRTPATNAKLRKRSNGVAKNSLHMEGRAVDFNIPGVPARTIQQAALKLQQGGVGYYAKSGFVHIDTGNFRHWERA